MKNKHKGYTLIELIIGLSIQIIIMSLGVQSVVISLKEYNNEKEIAIENDKIDEAILTIDRYLKKNMIEKIEINEIIDEISITIRKSHSETTNIVKRIKRDNIGRIVLESYIGDFKSAVNVVLRDTEKFDIVRKGEVNYIIIKTIKGEEKVICL